MEPTRLEAERTVEAMDGVFLTQLAIGDRMSIQHLRMEPGATIPEHSHHHEQLGFVYQGTQTFVVAGDAIGIEPGGSYYLASEEPHAAENRGDEVMQAIDIFSPPRPNPSWLD